MPVRPDLLVFDFDGVMTDDRVLVAEDGREAVACSRRDGLGIEMLRAAGVPMLVISKERNPVVRARCEKLKLPCLHGVDEKREILARELAARGIAATGCVYVGNDVNDLDCMAMVGFAVAPADAHPAVLEVADLVLPVGGGVGAVRHLADLILARSAEAGATAVPRS